MNYLQYSIVPPLEAKDYNYYKEKMDILLEELKLLCKKYTIILGIYDLIDEPNRVTREIIIQKKRIKPEIYLKMFKIYLKEKKIDDLNIKYRLFRAIRENETIDEFLNWFKNIGNKLTNSFVIIGNFKNKILRTNIALKELCIKYQENEYGCIIIPHRKDEYKICQKRIKLGCSFFVSQIIVDDKFTKENSLLYDNINVPIYFSITHITSINLWNLLLNLGVVSNYNYEEKIVKDKEITNNYLQKIINLIKNKKHRINFEILSHTNKIRKIYIELFCKLE